MTLNTKVNSFVILIICYGNIGGMIFKNSKIVTIFASTTSYSICSSIGTKPIIMIITNKSIITRSSPDTIYVLKRSRTLFRNKWKIGWI